MLFASLALFAQQAQFGPRNQPDPAAAAGGMLASMACCLLPFGAFMILIVVSLWKVFTKAGQPGWAALVPIYNIYVLVVEIAKQDMMFFILQFVPLVNIYASFVTCIEVAKKFGKSDGFGVGIFFLPFIFYPMLAFGDATYGRKKKKKRRDDYDDEEDEDDDDRPQSRRRRDDDEDDRYDDEDDEDDRPRRRRR